MKSVVLRVVTLTVPLVHFLWVFMHPGNSEVYANQEGAKLKEVLPQQLDHATVRSRHPAVDRLLRTDEHFAQTDGHDKSTHDKNYDKAYNRDIYSKEYSKGS